MPKEKTICKAFESQKTIRRLKPPNKYEEENKTELIIVVILFIGMLILFFKATNEISKTPVTGALAPEYWGTGDRYLVEDFITEDQLEKMRKKVNSKDSKF